MSFKTITRVVVGSAILGTAVLAPSVAQAKSAVDLVSNPSLAACDGGAPATGSITGAVSPGGLSYSVKVPSIAAGATYELRARIFTVDASGKQNFATKKTRVSFVTDTASSTLSPGQHIYRLDVSNLTAEAAGLPALAYTSDGLIGCD